MPLSHRLRFLLAPLAALLPLTASAAPTHSLGTPDPSVCQPQAPQFSSVDVNAPGRWNNADRPGTGWELSYNEDRTTVEAIWYTFAENGQPEWLSTGQVQWKVQQAPDGVASWSAPLLRTRLVGGTPGAPERVGDVAFHRIDGDATRLAVRWQFDGQATFEEECLVDRVGVGFAAESSNPNLDRGWVDPGSDVYRLQWVVESLDQATGNRRERPDLLTFGSSGQPIWLTAQSTVSSQGPAAEEIFSYRYVRGSYPGGRPTQAAADSCQLQRGCAFPRTNVGTLTRTALQDGQIDWSVDIRRQLDVPELQPVVRSGVQAQPATPGPQVLVDDYACGILPNRDNCPSFVRLEPAQERNRFDVVLVDLDTGNESPVTLDQNGIALVPLPSGNFRFLAKPVVTGFGPKSSSQSAAEASSLDVEVYGEGESPNTTLPACFQDYPAAGEDFCEPDDSWPGTWAFRGFNAYHNFHADDHVDEDWKALYLYNDYAGTIYFEPGTPGELDWEYQLLRYVSPGAGAGGAGGYDEVVSEGPLGAFLYNHIAIPARSDGAFGQTTYKFRVRAVNPSLIGTDSRYKTSVGYFYDPINIGADTFEDDNGWETAKKIVDGEAQIRNFHDDQDTDWIKLSVAEGDVQTLTLQPETASDDDKWQYRVEKLTSCDGVPCTEEIQDYRDFGQSPVTQVYELRADVHGAGTFFINVDPVQQGIFYGQQSVYTASLSVVSTIDPDEYEQGNGDNTRQDATPLQVGVAQLHNFHTGSDRDWMSWIPTQQNPLPAGSTVSFTIEPQDDPPYTAAHFAAQLWTLDGNGIPVQIHAAFGGYEVFGHPGTTMTQLSEYADQPYWLEMYSNDAGLVGDPSEYTVTLTTSASTPLGDDYEEDDSIGQASEISPVQLQAQFHDFHDSYDGDWVKVRVQPGQTAYFHPKGTGSSDLSWKIRTYFGPESNPTPVKPSPTSFDDRRISAGAPHSGGAGEEFVYAKVYSDLPTFYGPQSAYTMEVSVEGGVASGEDWLESAIEPAPVPANVVVPPQPGGIEVGSTAGNFRVDESGSATYQIPLYVAPATGNVAPEFSLNYSSSGGPGTAGWGWSLSGQSAISRCRQTTESGDGPGPHPNIDFSDANDRYCVDGQRLISVGNLPLIGQVYRTEIDSLTNFVPHYGEGVTGGPAYWVGYAKDGTIHYFGLNGHTHVQAQCSAPANGISGNCNGRIYKNQTDPVTGNVTAGTAVLSWQLSKVVSRDPAASSIEFAYDIDQTTADAVLREVKYSGSDATQLPTASTRFNYVASANPMTSFMAGTRTRSSRRLSGVESRNADGQLIRTYALAYELSDSGSKAELLTSVTEQGPDGASYAPTKFEWNEQVRNFQSVANFSGNHMFEDMLTFKFGDINGDGRTDIVWLKGQTNDPAAPIQIARTTISNGQIAFTNAGTVHTVAENIYDRERSWQLLDFNQDGMDDLLILRRTGLYNGTWQVHLSNGTTFQTQAVNVPNAPTLVASTDGDAEALSDSALADFNGDGLIDLVLPERISGQIRLTVRTLTPATTAFSCDTSESTNNCPYQWSPPATINLELPSGVGLEIRRQYTERFEAFDANGDGRADLRFSITCQNDCLDAFGAGESSSYSSDYSVVSWENDAVHVEQPDERDFLPGTRSAAGETRYWVVFTHQSSNQPGQPQNYDLYAHWKSEGSGAVVSKVDDEFRLADLNGDGLVDALWERKDSDAWYYQINEGNRFAPAICVTSGLPFGSSCPRIDNSATLRLQDYNGDGFLDIWVGQEEANDPANFCPGQGSGSNQTIAIVLGREGGFTQNGQRETVCDSGATAFGEDWFIREQVDLDGDGQLDMWGVNNPDDSCSGSDVCYRTIRRNHIFANRDSLKAVTNAMGARTEITYAPMTFSSVYKPDRGSGQERNWGRGSAVFDLLAPQQVVAMVRSSAPNAETGQPAWSAVRYRYAGAKAQAGSRGNLGMRKVWSLDLQTLVETESEFLQQWPFTARTKASISRYIGQVPALYNRCGTLTASGGTLAGDSTACFRRAAICSQDLTAACDEPLPSHVALASASDQWGLRVRTGLNTLGAAGAAVPAAPSSLFVYQVKSTKTTDEIDSSTLQSQGQVKLEESIFEGVDGIGETQPGYDGNGNSLGSSVTVWDAQGNQLQRQINRFTYLPNTLGAQWVPGLLDTSVVTATRGSDSKTRRAKFEYTNYGAVRAQHTQHGGDVSEALSIYTLRNSHGLPIGTFTCSNHYTEAECTAHTLNNGVVEPTGLLVEPRANAQTAPDPYRIRRFTGTQYDSRMRYVDAEYAPFDVTESHNDVSTLVMVSQVQARNAYGAPTQSLDANGIVSHSHFSKMGRSYFSYVTGTGSGTASHYEWCIQPPTLAGTSTTVPTVACPSGAVYRVRSATAGAPESRTYFDSLGRQILSETAAFQANQWNAVSVGYDRLGRAIKSTEPYVSTGGQYNLAPTTGVTTTQYDILGRATLVILPDDQTGHLVRSATRYNATSCPQIGGTCLLMTMTDAEAHVSREYRNPLGEVVVSEDALGYQLIYTYDAHGNLASVTRDRPASQSSVGTTIVTTTSFDALGRRTALNDPDMGTRTFSYNALGETIREVDAKNQCIQTIFDVQGRLFERTDRTGGCSGAVQARSRWQFDTLKFGLPSWEEEQIEGLRREFSYDGLARPVATDTEIGAGAAARAYRQEQTYDQFGRPFQSLDLVFPNGHEHGLAGGGARQVGVRYTYNSHGHQTGFVNAQLTSDIYYQVLEVNARGQITKDRRGDTAALERTLHFDLKTGRLLGIVSGQSGALQDLNYGYTDQHARNSYDKLGNLLYRHDRRSDLLEQFGYDDLSRLTSSTITIEGTPVPKSYSYDSTGNLMTKGGLSYTNGHYSGVGHSCTRSSVGPHMVTQVSAGGSLTKYCYDANGNQISAGDGNPSSSAPGQRLIQYAVHDKPLTITTTGNEGIRTSYQYGTSREIVRRVDGPAPGSSASGVTEVDYVGSLEVHYLPDQGNLTQRREYRRQLANAVLITLKSERNSGSLQRSSTRHYRFEEKLGSIDVLTDSQGQVVQRMSFDVWGERRAEADWSTLSLSQIIAFDTSNTRKGYTGHEQVDQANLIHMGGRIYDPHIGRFLSADPLVQAPHLSQSYNRYSYVLNNPMNYVDPTGYSWLSDNWRTVAAIAVAWIVPQALTVLTALKPLAIKVIAGMASGAVRTGTLRGALVGGFSAGVFHGIGSHFNELAIGNHGKPGLVSGTHVDVLGEKVGGLTSTQFAQKIASHAIAGGVMEVLGGGKFGHGFVSAGFGEALSPVVIQLANDPFKQFAAGVVIGGTGSRLVGGKFANGAVTAAFQWAFNHQSLAQTVLNAPDWMMDVPQAAAIQAMEEMSPEHRKQFGDMQAKSGAVVLEAAMFVVPIGAVGRVGLSLYRIKFLTPYKLGLAGEKAVHSVFSIGSKKKFSINGRNRIPDGVTSTTLSEVKNVKSLSYTRQLRDFADIAKRDGLSYDLYVRPSTRLSGPLEEAIRNGTINLKFIPGAK